MKVCVLGLGYIGLPTAIIVAENGCDVIGVDINPDIVKKTNQAILHIEEPNFDELLQKQINNKTLKASLTPVEADMFIIAVPTPINDNYTPLIDYVIEASHSIAPFLKDGNTIIIESTSPVGTTIKVRDLLIDLRPDLSFPSDHNNNAQIAIAFCPERVLPGKIMHELQYNDRIIGGITKECAEKAHLFYKNFIKGTCVFSTASEAELTKLAENTFRDINIAFANELSMICDELNIDVHKVIKNANLHPRVNILTPSIGVGGHCIAVDPWFIVSSSPNTSKLIKTAREVNLEKTNWVVDKIIKKAVNIENIVLFGLAYKADSDDLRESPSIKIVQSLLDNTSKKIHVVEPYIQDKPKTLNLANFCNLKDVLKIEDSLFVMLVPHQQFKHHINELKKHEILDFSGLLNG